MDGPRWLPRHGMDAGTISRTDSRGVKKLTSKAVQNAYRREYAPDNHQRDTAPINNTIHRNSPRAANNALKVLARSSQMVIRRPSAIPPHNLAAAGFALAGPISRHCRALK